MKKRILKMARVLAAAGMLCLLAGTFAGAPPARSASFAGGTVACMNPWSTHFSYGNWVFSSASWLTQNSRDFSTPGYPMPFSTPLGWSAWVVYDYDTSGLAGVGYLFNLGAPR